MSAHPAPEPRPVCKHCGQTPQNAHRWSCDNPKCSNYCGELTSPLAPPEKITLDFCLWLQRPEVFDALVRGELE